MARTTAALVQKLLNRDYDPNVDLTPFMDTADSMMDQVVALVPWYPFTSSQMEIICRWMSAHFYVMNDRTYASKSTDLSSASFDGKTAMYLEATTYGQTALRLDPTGCLSAIGGSQRKVAKIFGGNSCR